MVCEVLGELDDSYYLINGVVIPPNRGDTDHIVVGPNGIFVLESKNYGGEIECDGDSWVRFKVGGKGKRYELWVGSPSRQVIFNGEVPHIWVHSLLVFTNENAGISVKNPAVDILRIGELPGYIKNKTSALKLTGEEAQKIGNVIIKYSR